METEHTAIWWVELAEFGEHVLRLQREKLGLTQEQMAQRIGIDQSRISRIERGSGTPKDYPTAEKFAQAYQLKGHQTDEWFRLLFGVTPAVSISPTDIVDILRSNYQNSYKIRMQGFPQLAIELAEDTTSAIERIIARSPSTPCTHALLGILAELLYDQSVAHMEVQARNEILPILERLAHKISTIAKTCNDTTILGLAQSLLGNVYYITKQYAPAISHLEAASRNLRNGDFRLFALRALALSFAYIQEDDDSRKNGLERVEREVRSIIDAGEVSHPEHVCQAYEGIGRAQGLLRSHQAFDTFQEGWTAVNEINIPIREVQLARSELEVMQYVAPTDKTILAAKGERLLSVARERGYQRHAQVIEKLLTMSLN